MPQQEKGDFYRTVRERLLKSARLDEDDLPTGELDVDLLKHRDALLALDDLWPQIAHILGNTMKQAADFVEMHFEKHSLSLYLEEMRTGLWYPIDGESVNDERVHLMEAWNTAEDLEWDPARLAECSFPRLSRCDAKRVLREAHDIREVTPADAEEQTTRESWADDPRLPEELSIAFTAWRAACNNAERENKRPGAYIREWLSKHDPGLSEEARKRIATVANWDKSPGRR